jgi:hypothetical protein
LRRVQKSEHVIEGAIFQHEHDDVLNVRQAIGHWPSTGKQA